jgi:hypothetical protein
MPSPIFVHFNASGSGAWRIDRIVSVIGEALPVAGFLDIVESPDRVVRSGQAWQVTGFTSNTRYTTRHETGTLASLQQGLGRSAATRAALIPIRKSEAWWALAQDDRRAVFEEQSRHIAIGLEYLPPIARRLHHCRDLGEPFDFLTWFEYAPEHSDAFEQLVLRLRQTAEWRYVDREVDIRLSRSPSV